MLKHLEEQEFLFKKAQTDSDPTSRACAVKKIDNQDFLKSLYYNEPKPFVRQIIAERIKDEPLLVHMVYNDEDFDVQYSAARNPYLKNQSVLKKLLHKRDDYLRTAAVENPNLTDENLLEEVAYNDSSHYVRRAATIKINNESILTNIAFNDPAEHVRALAAYKIKDAEILREIILRDDSFRVRLAVVRNSNFYDEEIFENLTYNDPSIFARQEAGKRINIDCDYGFELVNGSPFMIITKKR